MPPWPTMNPGRITRCRAGSSICSMANFSFPYRDHACSWADMEEMKANRLFARPPKRSKRKRAASTFTVSGASAVMRVKNALCTNRSTGISQVAASMRSGKEYSNAPDNPEGGLLADRLRINPKTCQPASANAAVNARPRNPSAPEIITVRLAISERLGRQAGHADGVRCQREAQAFGRQEGPRRAVACVHSGQSFDTAIRVGLKAGNERIGG